MWTYVLDAYEGGLPSASYLGVLADAAEAADAPDDYVAAPAPPAVPVDRALAGQVVARRAVWQTASTLLPSGSRTNAP